VKGVIIGFYHFHLLSEHILLEDLLSEIYWFGTGDDHLCLGIDLRRDNREVAESRLDTDGQTVAVFGKHLASEMGELKLFSDVLQGDQVLGV
jgi:hypothetical protein